jgi:hypothetical protein
MNIYDYISDTYSLHWCVGCKRNWKQSTKIYIIEIKYKELSSDSVFLVHCISDTVFRMHKKKGSINLKHNLCEIISINDQKKLLCYLKMKELHVTLIYTVFLHVWTVIELHPYRKNRFLLCKARKGHPVCAPWFKTPLPLTGGLTDRENNVWCNLKR